MTTEEWLSAASTRAVVVATYRLALAQEEAMSDLSVKVEALQTAVDALQARLVIVVEQVPQLQAALAASQQALVDLRAAEDLEDVAQQAALDQANAALDGALADASAAADRLGEITAEIDTIAPEQELQPPQ